TFRRLPPDKKERIYRATIELFGNYGYDGVAVDQLCRECGISKGSFFQYFASKSHLLEFDILVLDDFLGKWIDEVRRTETAVLARDRIQYLYRSVVINTRLFRAEQTFYLFVTNALQHAGVTLEGIDLERHFFGYVTDIVRRGVQTGEVRGDFEVELTSHLVSLIVGALVSRQYSPSRSSHRETEDYLISFLFDGIKA
ncbi:MAG: TetR/AcrR family transcriptional regulator, partial [candidate division Zixibacteria bacterium]|nr:TetR/AcrR family transcriptional regulator [candidate division Zixibacteria bacterium]